MVDMAPPEMRSRRATRDLAGEVVTPLKQIRVPSGNVMYGAWCYYLRLDGETIRDAVILAPNGGNAPDNPDPKLRARYGMNAEYYHARARAEGREVLGPKLTTAGVRRIVEVLLENREEAVAYCEDMIAQCNYTIATTGIEKDRTVATRRKQQFQKRLDTVLQPFDPDELVAELDEISRAQRMSRIDPNTRAAIAEMFESQFNAKFDAMVNHFSRGSARETDPEMEGAGVKAVRRNRTAAESIFDD